MSDVKQTCTGVLLRTVHWGNSLAVSDAKQTCTGVLLRTVHQGNSLAVRRILPSGFG